MVDTQQRSIVKDKMSTELLASVFPPTQERRIRREKQNLFIFLSSCLRKKEHKLLHYIFHFKYQIPL